MNQIRYFAWHEACNSFIEVTEEQFNIIRNRGLEGFINNTVKAELSDSEFDIWQYDINLGGVFGKQVTALVDKIAEIQKSLKLNDGHIINNQEIGVDNA